jgi:GT2 family glycosyltransferase
VSSSISAIVPTIGRRESLITLLDALAAQTRRPDEVLVADGSGGSAIKDVVGDSRWAARGLDVRYLHISPPNAVRQREAAIAQSRGALLLLLDDDVVPEPECVAALADCLQTHAAVAVGADFSNQQWPRPTMLWRWYLRLLHGITDDAWQGRVIGPLLRFGYVPTPPGAVRMEWLGAGHSLIRRDTFERVGGFSDFFLHRSTVNEDVDLGLKLARIGPMFLCPEARMAHLEAPAGRPSVRVVAEDDLYNRYVILRQTVGRRRAAAVGLALTFFIVETLSGLSASARRLRSNGFGSRFAGRVKALARIAAS